MKIKVTNTGNLKEAILQSGLIEHIERVIEMDEIGAGVEAGFIYVVPLSVAQDIIDDRCTVFQLPYYMEEDRCDLDL